MLAPFGMLGIIEDQIHGVPRLRDQGLEQFLRLLLQRGFGVRALQQKEVIEAGPVVLDVQTTA
jgi:acetolactate synthase regulatory subunit